MVKICDQPYETQSTYNLVFEKYPFELSDFQKYAIQGIHENKHILITAHTASGKTLPAEHAIEYFTSQNKRVIYTTPLKALTNQKTNDFKKKFPNISFGTITGDIKTNMEAECLLMTTEILRNTLYHQQMIEKDTLKKDQMTLHFEMDVHRELGAVIFDEVHYINDKYRGAAVEETIMMLPKNVMLIMLSATIDPAKRFAQWIETIKGREVWWTPTTKRIVPLTHYSFLTLRKALIDRHGTREKLIDNKLNKPLVLRKAEGLFQDKNYHEIAKIMRYFKINNIFINRTFVLNALTEYLRDHNLLPAICFVLSRKRCDEFARSISYSLNDGKTMNIIRQRCKKLLIEKLPNYQEYTNLVEYEQMVNLLMKGIAVHHSGVHPILREMIEFMFGEGYVQLLFATETFSAGINVPAKTVVFTGLQKFDGQHFRYLLPHEYTQMAGRAGRRSIDDKGTIIHLNNMFKLPPIQEYRNMLCGTPQKLTSKFNISFTMVLQLISTQRTFTDFIKSSMFQGGIERECRQIQDNIDKLKNDFTKKKELLQYCNTPTYILEQYVEIEEKIGISSRKLRKILAKKKRTLEVENKYLHREVQKQIEIHIIEKEIEKENTQLKTTQGFIESSLKMIIDILTDYGFIKNNEDGYPHLLTDKGKIAVNIQEVNGMVFGDLLNEKQLNIFTARELVAIFSCFANISIPKEQRIQLVTLNLTTKIMQILYTIQDYYREMEGLELRYHIDTNEEYSIKYELVLLMLDWCETSNEEECKKILYKSKQMGISIGEFTKAILKINNIAKEFEKVCVIQGNMELLEQIKMIPTLTLKSIATNQSLYL
jgi:superfamily II RNA helicase